MLGYNSTYFSNKIHKGKTCYSEEQVISMLEFLIVHIFICLCLWLVHSSRSFGVSSLSLSLSIRSFSSLCPPELEVKETTDTASSASFLDLYLEFDDSGQLSTKIYDKRDDFNFKIINFPNMCSNIPASPAYGVYIVHSIIHLPLSLLKDSPCPFIFRYICLCLCRKNYKLVHSIIFLSII